MTVIIDGTNGITDVDGSVSTPALTGTDTNTGIFFPAADTIAFAEGGAEVLRIDSSGNVGIGTSSPSNRLQVYQNASAAVMAVQNQTTSLQLQVNDGVATGAGVMLINGAYPLTFWTNGSERMRIDSSGNLLFNSGYGSVATAYACRAWVNFNGTGTVAIRASANVTSITDSGVGLYDVNFTTAMPDANYAVAVTAYSTNSAIYAIGGQTNGQAPTTAKFRIATGAGASLGADTTAGYADLPYIFASVFR